ncbi:G protein-regulated inducer of neurite outgrowth 3 [Varanus komodoensis]|uniref:GPRIN family member 3 n=1 Tax=Varanus komodoensis TaxID=61221 RepID=A0A8D2Q3D6_VARKO|nr:G protein-regulated inducer of neurite outgrowth 3 [Varanus komodoensis]
MGTVPDPLRSAKLSLVTACEEENGLTELQSPKHQHKPASIERSSNGYPFSAKMQPAGEHLFELKYATEADIPRGERHCGYDMNRPSMLSPGSLSHSKIGRPAPLEPVNNSEQEANRGTKGQLPADASSSVQAAVKVPARQEATQTVQSDAYGGIGPASSPSGGGMVSKPHDDPPPAPTPLKAQQPTPAPEEMMDELVGPRKTQAPASVKELEPVSDLDSKAPACLDTDLKGTKNTSPAPSAWTGPEMEPKSSLESPPRPLSSDEMVERAMPEPSKFRDTGTMTVQPEGKLVMSRSCQDAEVQAVASVESKSASTSPSILAAYLRESMPAEPKEKQEQLEIIYTEAGGKEPSILPEVCIQAPAAVDGWQGVQAVGFQDNLAGRADIVHTALLVNTEHPCPPASGTPQETSVQRTEVQIADMTRSHSDVPQPLLDSSVLLRTRPAHQATISASNQPAASPHPPDNESKLPPCSSFSESNPQYQQLGSSPRDNQQASPLCRVGSEQAKAVIITVGAHGSNQVEQLPAKTPNDFEISPDSLMDVKPKKEGTFIHLGLKEQEASNTGVDPGPQKMCARVAVQKEQTAFPAANQEAVVVDRHHLPIDLESELGRNPVPCPGTQNNETRKGPELDLPAPPDSGKPVPSLGGNKEESMPATEAKVQLKHSKHVRDVVWDEQGMTWEVYGASLDPESLGIAIQNHLQRQIREHEKLIKAQSTQTRKSISSDTSSNKKLKGRHHNVFQSMLQNFRRPNCCVRPAASSVLD